MSYLMKNLKNKFLNLNSLKKKFFKMINKPNNYNSLTTFYLIVSKKLRYSYKKAL